MALIREARPRLSYLLNMQHLAIGPRSVHVLRKTGLQPAASGRASYDTHPLGLDLATDTERVGGRVVVFGVYHGSAAAEAGLTPFCFVLAVNGESMDGRSLRAVQLAVRSAACASDEVVLEVGEPVGPSHLPENLSSPPG